jgi:hypothetical protein
MPDIAPTAAPAASAPASSPAPAAASSPAPSSAPASSAPASSTTPATTPAAAPASAATPAEIKPESFPNQEAYARALLAQEMEQIPKDGEEPAGDTKPAAAPGEDAKPADQAATEETQQQTDKPAEEEYTFDLDEPAVPSGDPEALTKLLTDKPEFGALLEKDPELKELVYANAREAAEAKQFHEIFPDVQSAKFAHENASTFVDVRDTFLGSTTPDGTKATLAKMAQLAIERDEQGNPIIDPLTGQAKIGDDFYGFLDHTRDINMQYDREELQQRLTANQYPTEEARERDQIAAAALDVLKDYYGGEQAAGTQDMPQELQARAQDLDRRERELNDRARNEKVSERKQFEQGLINDSQTRVTGAINRIFDSIAKQGAVLSPFLREVLPNKIGSELMKSAAKDPKLKADMAELQRLPMSAEVRSRRLALLDKAVQTYLPGIAKAQLKAAGVQTIRNQQDKLKKIDAQKDASRSDPKGSAAAASPVSQQPISEDAAWTKAEATWKQRNPDKPVDLNQVAQWSIRLQTGQSL